MPRIIDNLDPPLFAVTTVFRDRPTSNSKNSVSALMRCLSPAADPENGIDHVHA